MSIIFNKKIKIHHKLFIQISDLIIMNQYIKVLKTLFNHHSEIKCAYVHEEVP